MSIHEEIKHYLLRGSYHWRTSNHGNPESRKSVVRRASKTYVMKDEKLYYRHQGKLRLVLFTRDQVREALKECHDNNQGTRGHPGRQRTYKKVSASYHWQTLWKDVHKWVDECPGCRHHERLKTFTPHERLQTFAPVLRPVCVKEAWTVLQVDLIGPLPTTAKGKRFILMATDLFTRWVVAKPLYTKTACEVSRKLVNILLDLGLVQRIVITDQGPGFVDEVNRGVFEALGVRPCVTSYHRPQGSGQDGGSNQASHPQTSGQDGGSNQASHPQTSGQDGGKKEASHPQTSGQDGGNNQTSHPQTSGQDGGSNQASHPQGSGQDGGKKEASHPQTSGQDGGNNQTSHPQTSGQDGGSNQASHPQTSGQDGGKKEASHPQTSGQDGGNNQTSHPQTSGQDGGSNQASHPQGSGQDGGKKEASHPQTSGQDGGNNQTSHPQTSGQDGGSNQASHPQTSGQAEGNNQIIMDALSKYRSDNQNDWDVHLRGIVAAINTSKESSTKYTPYCALFGRHPRVSGDINGKHREDDGMSVCVVMEETEEQLESRMKHVSDMHAKIYQNIRTVQDMQRKAYEKIKESLPEPVLPEPWLHEHSYCTLPQNDSFQVKQEPSSPEQSPHEHEHSYYTAPPP